MGTLLLAGCATTVPRPARLSQTEIISMTKAGMPDAEIIHGIDATRTVFRLSADEVVRLRQEGVSDRVVNHMLDTYTRYAVAEQRKQDAYDYEDFYFHHGFYYGHPWYRWWW